jgi:hypothetical protein
MICGGAQPARIRPVHLLVTTSHFPRLELRLIPLRDLSPAEFPALAEHRVTLGGTRITLRVIGASSLVIVETDALALVELIACGAPTASALATAAVTGGPGSNSAVAVAQPGFSYSATLWTARFGDERAAPAYSHLVEHRFPGPYTPLTRIEAGERDGAILLRTRHDYPEAATVVWSESQLRFLP